MEFVDALGGFLIGSFAVLVFSAIVVIPGAVAFIAGVCLGITAAIPIIIIGALTYLVPRNPAIEELHSEQADTHRT